MQSIIVSRAKLAYAFAIAEYPVSPTPPLSGVPVLLDQHPAPESQPARGRKPDARVMRAPELHLAGLEQIVGLHLGIGHSLLVLKLEPRLKPLGLTAKQVTILWLAEANPDITQIEISRFLGIERATIHQFTKSLVKNGMIAIEPSHSDRRATRLQLTDKGRLAVEQARAVIAEHEAEATAMLTPIERRLLVDLLVKLRVG